MIAVRRIGTGLAVSAVVLVGAGLGLMIVHRIVHDHGGTMTLYNREEGGAGVRIELPR